MNGSPNSLQTGARIRIRVFEKLVESSFSEGSDFKLD